MTELDTLAIAGELRREARALAALADRIHPQSAPTRADLDPTPGALLVTAERSRQITDEGYDPRHDREQPGNELAWGAFCYLERAAQTRLPQDDPSIPHLWPWTRALWKPKPSRIRNLVRAAALIVAEIDRALSVGERP